MKRYLFLLILFFTAEFAHAQDTLPNFTVVALNKTKTQISWTNPYSTCIQLAVQRSTDSLNYFTTIYATQYPNLPQNGIVDSKFPADKKVYYRIFYVLKGGYYTFTTSKLPKTFTQSTYNNTENNKKEVEPEVINPVINTNEPKKYICVYKKNVGDTLAVLDYQAYRRLADSVMTKTKDTLHVINAQEAIIKPFVPKIIWKPSVYVFTNKQGIVQIKLPQAANGTKYKLIVNDANGEHCFTIPHITETELLLEKGNFLHAGWFLFELYQNDKLLEKNRFCINRKF